MTSEAVLCLGGYGAADSYGGAGYGGGWNQGTSVDSSYAGLLSVSFKELRY